MAMAIGAFAAWPHGHPGWPWPSAATAPPTPEVDLAA